LLNWCFSICQNSYNGRQFNLSFSSNLIYNSHFLVKGGWNIDRLQKDNLFENNRHLL
jgi:hypothetical protein